MCLLVYCISIHAPTRGATYTYLKCLLQLLFQSTLLQEERLFPLFFYHILLDFNPRSYKRSDHPTRTPHVSPNQISIHAPTRGATFCLFNFFFIFLFQSTLLQEERRLGVYGWHRLYEFQSTLLQEEQPRRSYEHKYLYNFNPRSYKRSDVGALNNEKGDSYISIHAPTRGATPVISKEVAAKIISIHAPTRGATIGNMVQTESCQFQSTLLQEERPGNPIS